MDIEAAIRWLAEEGGTIVVNKENGEYVITAVAHDGRQWSRYVSWLTVSRAKHSILTQNIALAIERVVNGAGVRP